MIAIALAHGLKYVAQSTAGHIEDIEKKVKKASQVEGPSYIQILTPCIPGWKIPSNASVNLGKLAADTGLYPLLEYEDGELVGTNKIKEKKSVEEYLKLQGRFKHLAKSKKGKEQIRKIQELADENIKKYDLAG
jgi:pyruvate ferredoxin oxidoreductase beta subunit